ncbi:hypothetical protein Poli38472_010182 [Pythium oligandrum]|uniref:Arrestin-like N-terminal domain-containing protein n=1 Tax=Pythium oligandrum TaxID=41045 RepID=A0A8K1C902_PYTOL|nr:hypothetical protein Poli38472_010182 [Pythium oligandrum]|eukprot:TMW58623.1 hypothetical protein Poli38472_010182 [Pythium oligandrum]
MGNQNGKRASIEGARVQIKLEQSTLNPGDKLRGTVAVKLEKRLEDASLVVVVRGFHRIKWVNKAADKSHSYHKKSVDCFIVPIALESWQSSTSIGLSEHPFKLTLPKAIPPSFCYKKLSWGSEMDDVEISTQYIARVTLQTKTAALESIRRFQVERLVQSPPIGKPIQVSTAELVGLVNKGECYLSFRLSSDVYSSSSMIEASVSVRLPPSRRLKQLRLVLYRYLTVDTREGGKQRQTTQRVCCRMYDGAALTRVSTNEPMTLVLPLHPNDLTLFEPLEPTSHSYFLLIEYRVSVECQLSWRTILDTKSLSNSCGIRLFALPDQKTMDWKKKRPTTTPLVLPLVSASLRIALERRAYTPLDTLRGSVRVDVKQPLQNTTLKVVFRGVERIEWLDNDEGGPFYHIKPNEHFTADVVLDAWPASPSPGVYDHSFELKLPEKLPASFHYQGLYCDFDMRSIDIRVGYTVTATLQETDGAKVETEKAFEVSSPLPRPMTGKPVHSSRMELIKFLRLFKTGECGMTVQLTSNVLRPPLTIEALVAIEAPPSRRIKHLRLVLYRVTTGNQHKAKRNYLRRGTDEVCSRVFKRDTIAGIAKDHPVMLRLPLTDKDLMDFEPLELKSHFLTINYCVDVECRLSWGGRVAHKIPVKIVWDKQKSLTAKTA